MLWTSIPLSGITTLLVVQGSSRVYFFAFLIFTNEESKELVCGLVFLGINLRVRNTNRKYSFSVLGILIGTATETVIETGK